MLETLTRRFADRRAAGCELAERLSTLGLDDDPVVLGLARGGVPVAYEVAQALMAPLDVLMVRKIGAPGNPELGIGAIAEGGVRVLDGAGIRRLLISTEELKASITDATEELEAGVRRYRGGRPPLEVTGRTAIVVDDGLATGGTARAALRAVRARDPRRLVLGVPVGAPEVVRSVRHEADDVVCLLQPDQLLAVGRWYEHFEPTSDAEIAQLLAGPVADPPADAPLPTREIRIPVSQIAGALTLPESAHGLVVFAQSSGSSRFSSRNQQLADALHEGGFATVRLDLLRWDEERDRTHLFDIPLLSRRLIAATRWVRVQPEIAELPIGYFGGGTGAAAALWAASELSTEIAAVVAYGGRPDLAAERLSSVRAPVLLIVGSEDQIVLELNQEARQLLRAPSEVAIVPGATHRFEEPGEIEEVSRLAGVWFERHLGAIRGLY